MDLKQQKRGGGEGGGNYKKKIPKNRDWLKVVIRTPKVSPGWGEEKKEPAGFLVEHGSKARGGRLYSTTPGGNEREVSRWRKAHSLTPWKKGYTTLLHHITGTD